MTAQTYHADDDQLVQEHDQVLLENNLTEPDAGPALAEAPPTEPDAGQALTEAPPTEPDAGPALAEAPPTEPDADQTDHEDPTSHPADDAAVAGHESAAVRVSDPGLTADGDDDAAAEPWTADSSPGDASMVSVAFTVPASVTSTHLAVNAASTRGPWNEVQAMFVDDPRASIEQAAGLVDGRVEALIQSLRERQRSMQSAWWADDAGTEELRVALQHYRTFWNSLEDLPAQD